MADHPARNLLIEVNRLVKIYQVGHEQVRALDGVDLNIHKGDSLAIMGRSGSGKSTLMHLLGCLDSPTSGSYFLEQEDVSQLDDDRLAAIRSQKIGFVFQSFNLIPELNVVENVNLPFTYQNDPPEHTIRLIEEALNKVGLSHRLHHHPRELSGGEMQRVAIARALVINPLLILADEPTGNLDSENGKAILNLFRELNEQNVTVVIVTHDPEVAKCCKRSIFMKDGKIIEER